MSRKKGYSIRGMPIKSHRLLIGGERVSAIACISLAGLLDAMTVKGTTDGDAFYDFIQVHLLPHLIPFNGVNPHSGVVMDNCAIHNIDGIVKSIHDVVHFLPPYSPDFQPDVFKGQDRTEIYIEESMHTADTEVLLLASFTSVTPQDCHAGMDLSQWNILVASGCTVGPILFLYIA